MKTSDIQVRTNDRYEFVSISDEVKRAVGESGVDEGICLVSSTHTTAAVSRSTRTMTGTCRGTWPPRVALS
jgi:thiamine phosphate synthase YjbQ (UPF0047 family)